MAAPALDVLQQFVHYVLLVLSAAAGDGAAGAGTAGAVIVLAVVLEIDADGWDLASDYWETLVVWLKQLPTD